MRKGIGFKSLVVIAALSIGCSADVRQSSSTLPEVNSQQQSCPTEESQGPDDTGSIYNVFGEEVETYRNEDELVNGLIRLYGGERLALDELRNGDANIYMIASIQPQDRAGIEGVLRRPQDYSFSDDGHTRLYPNLDSALFSEEFDLVSGREGVRNTYVIEMNIRGCGDMTRIYAADRNVVAETQGPEFSLTTRGW